VLRNGYDPFNYSKAVADDGAPRLTPKVAHGCIHGMQVSIYNTCHEAYHELRRAESMHLAWTAEHLHTPLHTRGHGASLPTAHLRPTSEETFGTLQCVRTYLRSHMHMDAMSNFPPQAYICHIPAVVHENSLKVEDVRPHEGQGEKSPNQGLE